ncbi:rhodanese [Colwellia sp. PAMC 20917]|jgi:hypothetical protein|uniref:YgaP family membrane protein n=1 Tax=unclassified Colwellia TaxID=196834 RepID=UPI000877F4BB|nr:MULTISPECIES: DUF2892 domain-containing protein [unclassified Colwellia]MBA6365240.1 DUF2892 domain-containing protein [Colwellia sp. BRX8-8]AOW77406.1 rhodanese [Colwellia sp. PAMC 20917]MBA6336616.1 DUF2892 domain-containing protein [Colwellia sp. BRX8-7]MBA6348565.1 DUF2892 domain-containing protein [Colwellia sp. BRX8-9]MBA6352406.1 DUF2892 domain-containing protein [Colwellia sp. BRX9-1]
MTKNDALRLIAGTMILISLILTVTLSINWLWFTAFIAVNLIQSSFTKWCPMMVLLKKIGLKD